MGDAVGSEVVEHALEHILHQPLFVSLQMSVTRPYGIPEQPEEAWYYPEHVS